MTNKTQITGIVCKSCNTFVWSRHQHDFRYCPCGKVAIDGGRQYTRIIGSFEDFFTALLDQEDSAKLLTHK